MLCAQTKNIFHDVSIFSVLIFNMYGNAAFVLVTAPRPAAEMNKHRGMGY